MEAQVRAHSCCAHRRCGRSHKERTAEGWGQRAAQGDTHHLIQGVTQEAVLVEDEEPPLPFLQRSTQRGWEGSGPAPPAGRVSNSPVAEQRWLHSFHSWGTWQEKRDPRLENSDVLPEAQTTSVSAHELLVLRSTKRLSYRNWLLRGRDVLVSSLYSLCAQHRACHIVCVNTDLMNYLT